MDHPGSGGGQLAYATIAASRIDAGRRILTIQAASPNSHLVAAIIGMNSFALTARYGTLAAMSRQMTVDTKLFTPSVSGSLSRRLIYRRIAK
ncbi:hypothetical protein [Janthinobacterium sp. Ant5-2-1]|uniref:hypothetical protein n=1 Tax=Janthinobacterium sp. Ant5-2-1 TaxID=1755239 RepID=UPI00128F6F70|nr:hypothetical protein [Janthinobacterium sp. Ant5-2-1]